MIGARRQLGRPRTPASLFGLGGTGFLFDFAVPNRTYVFNTAGTVVKANGDAIGHSRGFDPTLGVANQATVGSKPTFRVTGHARFDGTDDCLPTTIISTLAGTLAFYAIVGASASRTFIGAFNGANGRAYIALDASGRLAGAIGTSLVTTIFGGSDIRGTTGVGILKYDGSTVTLKWNGTQIYSGAQAGLTPTSQVFYIGGLNNNNAATPIQPSDSDIGKAMFINRALTDAEDTFLTNYWNTQGLGTP